jgi:dTDP-4-amino-4,6-dideoxygalactose transaminase
VIPITRPDIGVAEAEAVREVLLGGMIAQGKRVSELEQRWAERVGVRHAVAVSNGTVALMSIFAGLGLRPGDEVITVAHTFAATANAILFTGATPVFVDIEPRSYLMDSDRIEAAITPHTRAIAPVHLFGLVADMDPILDIAHRHELAVVEDAAQAHAATYLGRNAGSFGHGAFSLYATKNMTTAEGGLITTSDDRLADWLRLYRNQGMRNRYQFEIVGYNFRLTDVAAAIGLVQLDKLDRNTTLRREVAARYDAAFADLPIQLPLAPSGRTHVFHQYTVMVGPNRDAILADLRDGGIGADVYYPLPVHRQRYIQELGLAADLPLTDAAAATTLSLPIFPGLTHTEQDEVIAGVRNAVDRHVNLSPEDGSHGTVTHRADARSASA